MIHSDCTFPSLHSSESPAPSYLSQIHMAPAFLFRKDQTSQGCPLNMAQKDAIRIGTNSYIKAGEDKPVGRKGFQKQAAVSDTPLLTLLGASQNPQERRHVYAEDPCRLCDCLGLLSYRILDHQPKNGSRRAHPCQS